MTDSLVALFLASLAFVAGHLILSSRPVRQPLIGKIGMWPFRGLYSVVAGVLFTWMITAFNKAPEVMLFESTIGMKHLTLSVMALVSFLLVCGYTTLNPTAIGMEKAGLQSGPRGVLKITRHPIMWGVILWALSHILANGDAAALIFFGGLAVLAFAGACHIDMKRRHDGGTEWDAFMKETSHIPLLAILKGQTRVERGEYRWWQILLSVGLYAGLLFLHEPVIGRYVLPF